MRRNSPRGFLRGNEELLSAFQRLADLLSIAVAHYLACTFYRDSWRAPMTAATAIALVAFNLLAEWRGLYRPWRSERIARELEAAFTTWLAVPVMLFALGFITKTSASFSRAVLSSGRSSPTAICSFRARGSQALAASSDPNGRKYCVPLMGAETFLSSSCKSSLRSTKSISEVLTMSRSEDV